MFTPDTLAVGFALTMTAAFVVTFLVNNDSW